MKKAISLFLCLLFVFAVPVAVFAADGFAVNIKVDRETAGIGDEVTFTVSLTGAGTARSGSVEVIPGEGLEIVSGEMLTEDSTLSSFDLSKNKGVVAVSSLKDFDGDFARTTARVTEASADARSLEARVKLNPSGVEASGVGSVRLCGGEAKISDSVAAPGDEIKLDVTLSGLPEIKSLAVSDVVCGEALEFKGAEWTFEGAVMSSWDEATGKGVAAFRNDTDVNGKILTLTFTVKGASGEYPVSLKVTSRSADGETAVITASGTVTVQSDDVLIGDVNGDGRINLNDLAAIKKLLAGATEGTYVLANSDVNQDGKLNLGDLADIKKLLAGAN